VKKAGLAVLTGFRLCTLVFGLRRTVPTQNTMPEPTRSLTSAPPSPEFLKAFRAEVGPAGVMSFERFMALALYDPSVGYYRRNRPRVGRGRGTDFYTASNSRLFGELIIAACKTLLAAAAPEEYTEYTFVEIGAEPGQSILNQLTHPFAAVRTLRFGEPLKIEGRCVVFSNELFDAQPFRRLGFQQYGWKEFGVAWDETNGFREAALPASNLPSGLPVSTTEGYRLDLPSAATQLATKIASEPWTGLFLAFDYGKSWRELVEACPEGTARAYHRHNQSNDLFSRPGDQDLTCHICWDMLSEALKAGNFETPELESQEAFFIHHASDFIGALTAAEAARFSPRKLSLMQLLHPTHMGQKFQVLWARRTAAAAEPPDLKFEI
jgi:SAM-dependent MidA family methyltransferase